MGTTRITHEYEVRWEDDGHLIVTVIPQVWETMTRETWSIAARRRARQALNEAGIVVDRIDMREIDRERDWATDLPITITFRSVRAYRAAQSAA